VLLPGIGDDAANGITDVDVKTGSERRGGRLGSPSVGELCFGLWLDSGVGGGDGIAVLSLLSIFDSDCSVGTEPREGMEKTAVGVASIKADSPMDSASRLEVSDGATGGEEAGPGDFLFGLLFLDTGRLLAWAFLDDDLLAFFICSSAALIFAACCSGVGIRSFMLNFFTPWVSLSNSPFSSVEAWDG
jgi:hypothetical protein